MNLKQIGKLRHDANLRWLYKGEQKLRGRPKLYDGKVNFDDLSRFELTDEIDEIKLYTAVVNSVHFKRDLKIVYLVKTVGKKIHTAFEDKVFLQKKLYPRILFSTDLKLAAKDIYRFYKARFQIEFLFRDAKQFTGFVVRLVAAKQSRIKFFEKNFILDYIFILILP